MKKIVYLSLMIVLIIACGSRKNVMLKSEIKKDGEIVVYKHFLKCDRDINYDIFFVNTKCLADYNLYNPTIYDFISLFNDKTTDFEKVYAFLFLNKGKIDTLYADRKLNKYMLISQNKKLYYSLQDTLNIPFLNVIKYDQMDAFFKECW